MKRLATIWALVLSAPTVLQAAPLYSSDGSTTSFTTFGRFDNDYDPLLTPDTNSGTDGSFDDQVDPPGGLDGNPDPPQDNGPILPNDPNDGNIEWPDQTSSPTGDGNDVFVNPEPSSLALCLVGGLSAAAGAIRRRKRSGR